MTGFHILHGLSEFPSSLKECVVAIGNFDGLHRGHQSILNRAVEIAKEQNLPAILLTFEPHPGDVFADQPFMFRLTDVSAKARICKALGLNGLCVMPFSRELSLVTASDFVSNYLVDAMGVKAVVVGEDFHFGRDRGGTPQFLRDAGSKHGFEVVQLSLLSENADPVSSTRVRAALNTGDLDNANAMLGYHWIIEGEVVSGDQRGRELGYPTANFFLPPTCKLAHGVYATRLRLGERTFGGVASLGKPMFDIHSSPFEVHIFDFDEEIYGQRIEVALISHLRGQMTFDGLDQLIAQMDTDSEKARSVLKDLKPLSNLDAELGIII